MPREIGSVHAVLTGRIAPYIRPGTQSAIAKQPVSESVAVGSLGLEGDEHADTRSHGGPDKAVHFYAFEHYAVWRDELGATEVLAGPGAFGENISTLGIDEGGLCLGDLLQIGSVQFEITQGRQPCWKLNDRFGVPDMALRLQDTLRTGWYCRVRAEGLLRGGDRIVLLARPHPDWTLARLMSVLYRRCLDPEILRAVLDLPLVPNWRKLVEQRLVSGQIEDWDRRLNGPIVQDPLTRQAQSGTGSV